MLSILLNLSLVSTILALLLLLVAGVQAVAAAYHHICLAFATPASNTWSHQLLKAEWGGSCRIVAIAAMYFLVIATLLQLIGGGINAL